MTLNTPEIIIKAWDTYQGLIKGFGENCWKVRSVFISISTAIIAFAYTSDTVILYALNLIIIPLFCLLESGYRRLQSQCIMKSREIEKTINDILVGEKEPYLPDDGICTSFDTPTSKDLFLQFEIKRFLFWLPYLIFLIITIALLLLGITKTDLT